MVFTLLLALLTTLQQATAAYSGFEGYARGPNVLLTYYGANVPNKTYTYDALNPEAYPQWQGKQSGLDLGIYSGIVHGNFTYDQLPAEYRLDHDVSFNGTIVDGVISRNYYGPDGLILHLSDHDIVDVEPIPFVFRCVGVYHRPSSTCIVASRGS